MDKIKLDLFYDTIYNNLYSVVLVNGENLASMIVDEERKLFFQGKIDFVSSYAGLPPSDLLDELCNKNGNPAIMGKGDWNCDYYGYQTICLACKETPNSIVWNNIENPGRRKFKLPMSSFLDNNYPKNVPEDNTGLVYSFNFEFDKNQYHQALEDFKNKLVDEDDNVDNFIPYLETYDFEVSIVGRTIPEIEIRINGVSLLKTLTNLNSEYYCGCEISAEVLFIPQKSEEGTFILAGKKRNDLSGNQFVIQEEQYSDMVGNVYEAPFVICYFYMEDEKVFWKTEDGLLNLIFEGKPYKKAIKKARNKFISIIEQQDNNTEEFEMLYEDKQFEIIHIKTKKGSFPFWKNTELIGDILLEYDIQKKIYIIINKQNDRKYLFHFESNIFKNDDNRNLSTSESDTLENSKGLVEFFIKELNEKSDSYMKHCCLGTYYHVINNLSKSILHYKRATEYNSNDYRSYFDMGEAYYKLENYNNANVCFQKALELNHCTPGIYRILGITYGMIGEFEKAIKHFEKAIEVNPDDIDSKTNLASTYDMIAERDRG